MSSVEQVCWETGDRLVHSEESVETVRSAVSQPVFYKVTRTARSFSAKARQLQVHMLELEETSRSQDGDS